MIQELQKGETVAPATDILVRPPFALFLGDAADQRYVKTATGVLRWRPGECVAQVSLPGCVADVGLPEMDIASAAAAGARTLVIGLAPAGGSVPDSWKPTFAEALRHGLDIASGMHSTLADDPELAALAQASGARILDLRAVKQVLPIGTGRKRTGKRLLAVGTDCGVGKMFATLALAQAMRGRGANADFRATGQTGILIAGSGICIDAVVSDFIAGAAEWLSPDAAPDHWDVIEGQGSLFHPAYAGVTLGLLHGSQPDWLVICHDAGREMMVGFPGYAVPSVAECIEANLRAGRLVNPAVAVAGVCVNTSSMDEEAAALYMSDLEASLGIPVCDPLRTGVEAIVDRLGL